MMEYLSMPAPHLHRRGAELSEGRGPFLDGLFDRANGSTRVAPAASMCSRSRPANLKNPRTFDPSGLPLHKDGETIVKERFYLDKANPDALA